MQRNKNQTRLGQLYNTTIWSSGANCTEIQQTLNEGLSKANSWFLCVKFVHLCVKGNTASYCCTQGLGDLMRFEWAFGQIPQCPRGWPPGGSRWLMHKTGIPPWCTAIQLRPRPQGFFLKKWVGREKALCEKLKLCVTSRRAILGGLLYLLTINEKFFKISFLSQILTMVIFCFPLISMKGTASNICKTSVYRAV